MWRSVAAWVSRGRRGARVGAGRRNQAEKLIAGTEALSAWSQGHSNVTVPNEGGAERDESGAEFSPRMK